MVSCDGTRCKKVLQFLKKILSGGTDSLNLHLLKVILGFLSWKASRPCFHLMSGLQILCCDHNKEILVHAFGHLSSTTSIRARGFQWEKDMSCWCLNRSSDISSIQTLLSSNFLDVYHKLCLTMLALILNTWHIIWWILTLQNRRRKTEAELSSDNQGKGGCDYDTKMVSKNDEDEVLVDGEHHMRRQQWEHRVSASSSRRRSRERDP
ncbi:hypothetical protein L1887_21273 [Cichorium endivia]|nr:hypothetical protein L1887_21273 [Cichorium endivia]